MPIPTYTPGYPPDGASLGQTKAVIRNNLDGTFETLAIDHINNNGQPGSQPAGYHTIIHEVTQTSVDTVTGYNQIFSGVPGTLVVNSVTTSKVPADGDTQLYSLTGTGALTQLTGKSSTANGYCWAGGVLFQWGFVSTSAATGTVNFPIQFPTECFNVQITSKVTGTTTDNSAFYVNQTLTTTGFTWYQAHRPSTGTGFFWTAIGN